MISPLAGDSSGRGRASQQGMNLDARRCRVVQYLFASTNMPIKLEIEMMKRKLVVAAAFLGLSGLSAAEGPGGLVPEDFYQEIALEETAISPDGSLLAFTLMTLDEEKNERHREIWPQPQRRTLAARKPAATDSILVHALAHR